jgi:hypothetical protein
MANRLGTEAAKSRRDDPYWFGWLIVACRAEGCNPSDLGKQHGVDPITQSDEVAELCYDSQISSSFEMEHGWHINLMPNGALDGLPQDWRKRSAKKHYDLLRVEVPAPEDLLVPKIKRGEPRDLAHVQWTRYTGLVKT